MYVFASYKTNIVILHPTIHKCCVYSQSKYIQGAITLSASAAATVCLLAIIIHSHIYIIYVHICIVYIVYVDMETFFYKDVT